MLRQISKLQSLLLPTKNMQFWLQCASNVKRIGLPGRNLEFYNNFHTSISYDSTRGILFTSNENAFAFNIVNKEYLQKILLPSHIDKEISNLEFKSLVNQNWRHSSASKIVTTFKYIKKYCIEHNISLQDKCFNHLVDGLMDHCEKLSYTELLELLECISELPQCDNYDAPNFHDVWSCLDDICCWKMVEWNIEQSFAIANVWYKLNLGRLCDFIFVLIDRLRKRADKLSKDELINILFYFNICRRRPVDFEYEYALNKYVNELTVDELAVVAMGFFKTKTKIKMVAILNSIVEKVTANTTSIQEISLCAILKVLRFSNPVQLIPEINYMLDLLSDEIYRLSTPCNIQLALLNTGIPICHEKSLHKITEKVQKNINDVNVVRLKDMERVLNVVSMFDLNDKTDFLKACYIELHREIRNEEYIRYPRCLTCCLNYLSLRNVYSYELLNKVLNRDFILDTYGKHAKFIPRELFSLDCSIDIECPGYKGYRLPIDLRYKATKWQIEYIPSYDQYKKISLADRLVLDTIDTVEKIVGNKSLIFVDHILPHFSRADIVLCRNKNTKEFIEPPGFTNYILGDIKYPFKSDNLEWFAMIIVGYNNTIRDSNIPLGHMIMKRRQLEKIGYKPNFVIWKDFQSLTEQGKLCYISKFIK